MKEKIIIFICVVAIIALSIFLVQEKGATKRALKISQNLIEAKDNEIKEQRLVIELQRSQLIKKIDSLEVKKNTEIENYKKNIKHYQNEINKNKAIVSYYGNNHVADSILRAEGIR